MEYTQQQLQEKYKSLPVDLKDAIFSVQSAEIIQSISKKHHLQIDQMGELAAETGLVLLGFTKPEDYIKNLSNRLKINIKDAREVALEVNIEIFNKVKESLKKLHKIGIPAEIPKNESVIKKQSEITETKNEITQPAKIPETQTAAKIPIKILEENSEKITESAYKNFNFPKENEGNIKYEVISNPSVKKLDEKTEKSELKTTSVDPPPVPPSADKKNAPEILSISPVLENSKDNKTAETRNAAEQTNINKIQNLQKERIERFMKQTIEINLEKENKIIDEKYPSGDPYKEPV